MQANFNHCVPTMFIMSGVKDKSNLSHTSDTLSNDFEDATQAAGFCYQSFPALHPLKRRHKSHTDIIDFYRDNSLKQEGWSAKIEAMMESYGKTNSFHSSFTKTNLGKWLSQHQTVQLRYRDILQALYDSL